MTDNNQPQNSEEQKNAHNLQIELTPEVQEGIYCNMSIVSNTPAEFLIDFIRVSPMGTEAKAKVKSRIVLNPMEAKRLAALLGRQVGMYEQTFGTIGDGTPKKQEPTGAGRTLPLTFGGSDLA